MRRKVVYVLLSVAVAVVLMAVLFREIDPAFVKKTLLGLPISALAAFVLIHLFAVWLRAWRYKILLRPLPCSWSGIILTTLVRNSFDDLLPARIGSLSYIYILNQRLGFPFEAAASSFVVAFVLDFVTLGPFFLLALAVVGSGGLPLSVTAMALLALAFFLVSALVLWKLPALTLLIRKGFEAICAGRGWSSKPWAVKTLEKIELIRTGLGTVRRPRTLILIFVQSFFIRLAKYVSVYVLLGGFLRSQNLDPSDVGLWRTILTLTGAEFTAVLPVKGLGGFGTWEAAWTAVFRLLGFPTNLSVVTGLGVHLTTNILEYGLGLAAILLLLAPFLKRTRRSANRPPEDDPTPGAVGQP